MTWAGLNTLALIVSAFVVGVGLANYVQARTGGQPNLHLSLALTLLGTSGLLNAAFTGSRIAAVLSLLVVLAALPPLWRSLKSLSRNAA